MQKLLLMSVLIASVLLPVHAARAKDPRTGLKQTLVRIVVFNFFYALAMTFVWGRL
jgi:hypothetical protein